MSVPDYSILIPTHGAGGCLNEVVEALYGQRNAGELEIIVVCDGDAPAVLEAIPAPPPSITLSILEQSHAGPAVARNRAIDHASGTYLGFLGDDTVPDPDWLDAHKARRAVLGDDVAVIGYTDWHPRVAVTPFLRFINEYGLQFGYALIDNPDDLSYCFFYTSNLTLPESWLRDERFAETFPYAALEDIELGLRLQRKGLRIAYAREAKVAHDHGQNLSGFIQRQRRVGRSAKAFFDLHTDAHGFLGLSPAGACPPKPDLRLHAELVEAGARMDELGVHAPELWSMACRQAYVLGLHDVGLPAQDNPEMECAWLREQHEAMASTIRILAAVAAGTPQTWSTMDGVPAAAVPILPAPVRPDR